MYVVQILSTNRTLKLPKGACAGTAKQTARIRRAKISDYSICLPLFSTLYQKDIGPNFKQVYEKFVESKDNVVLLAAHADRIGGLLVGSFHTDMDWEGTIAKVDAIIVEEAFRRKGVGRKLFHSLITFAKQKQCKAIVSRVNLKNVGAQEFHESLGFIKAHTLEYILDLQTQQ
jgi:ribosomal protein S18 acetylase RimI-like enzyme